MKRRKNDLIQLAVLVTLGAAVILSLVLPQILQRQSRPEILSVSILTRDTDSSLWTNTRLGMEQAADELNAELRFLSLSAPNDAAEQDSLLRREIEGGADAVIAVPADPDAFAATLSELSPSCPVVSMESPAEGVTGTVAADPEALGQALAAALLEDWTAGPVLLLDTGGGINDAITARLEAAHAALTDAGVTAAVRTCTGEELAAGLGALLADTGSRWVMTFDAVSTLRAVEGMELAQRSVPLYGVGSTVDIISGLEQGNIAASATWSDYAAGYLAVEQAVAAAHGEDATFAPLPFSILRGEDIYEPNNQKLLFPVAS